MDRHSLVMLMRCVLLKIDRDDQVHLYIEGLGGAGKTVVLEMLDELSNGLPIEIFPWKCPVDLKAPGANIMKHQPKIMRDLYMRERKALKKRPAKLRIFENSMAMCYHVYAETLMKRYCHGREIKATFKKYGSMLRQLHRLNNVHALRIVLDPEGTMRVHTDSKLLQALRCIFKHTDYLLSPNIIFHESNHTDRPIIQNILHNLYNRLDVLQDFKAWPKLSAAQKGKYLNDPFKIVELKDVFFTYMVIHGNEADQYNIQRQRGNIIL